MKSFTSLQSNLKGSVKRRRVEATAPSTKKAKLHEPPSSTAESHIDSTVDSSAKTSTTDDIKPVPPVLQTSRTIKAAA